MSPRLHPWQHAGLSPVQRTLAWLRDRGWACAVVERWIPKARIRKDAFGCDLLAAHPDNGVLLVQACGTDVAAHVSKLRDNADAATFVEAGGEVIVMGWRELKAAGGWTPRIWRMSEDRELELDEVLVGVAWQPRLIA